MTEKVRHARDAKRKPPTGSARGMRVGSKPAAGVGTCQTVQNVNCSGVRWWCAGGEKKAKSETRQRALVSTKRSRHALPNVSLCACLLW